MGLAALGPPYGCLPALDTSRIPAPIWGAQGAILRAGRGPKGATGPSELALWWTATQSAGEWPMAVPIATQGQRATGPTPGRCPREGVAHSGLGPDCTSMKTNEASVTFTAVKGGAGG